MITPVVSISTIPVSPGFFELDADYEDENENENENDDKNDDKNENDDENDDENFSVTVPENAMKSPAMLRVVRDLANGVFGAIFLSELAEVACACSNKKIRKKYWY